MRIEKPLQRIAAFVGEQGEGRARIWVPEIWNTCGYANIAERRGGEILVDAYPFLSAHLARLTDGVSPRADAEVASAREPAKEGAAATAATASAATAPEADLDDSIIYSTLVRYSTAWDYDSDGAIESGTFLRFMLLLPLLKRMGVNIVYMLPVTRYSTLHLKGNIGSPYAVQSLFELDPNLHDPLLDGMPELTLHDELSALVEACHALGMRVVVDFIPRVTARNSDLLAAHPDWVYWIRKEALDGFRLPHIPELGFFEECTPDKLETVYRSAETADFLAQFSQPPNVLDNALWQKLKRRAAETGEELLTLVEAEMGVTTSPAHSDWINDVQPIWTDITFWRLYRDTAPAARPYIREDQPPYVLFDTIKCNYYPGEEPNRELWDLLVAAARFNLERYGIDGFRIDIGHVLPIPLLEEIFDAIRSIRPDALLISEDLFNRNHRKAAAVGYNIMLGSGWNVMTDIRKDNLLAYVRELPELDIHVFACAETADTPRITSRGGTALARMIAVFNHFLPRAIPFLATGFELNEERPMNCGLGDNTDGADIPRAFFHEMAMDWTNPSPMIGLLERLSEARKRLAAADEAGALFFAGHAGRYRRLRLSIGCGHGARRVQSGYGGGGSALGIRAAAGRCRVRRERRRARGAHRQRAGRGAAGRTTRGSV
ncbi:alpha-amylase family protein [Cohnella rhizosphaerae]|uniref:Alpha-amylase n=1 Tax=Cohnella rhizosphaerae TaxID=1457232 RepID=A0A9X4KSN3_9BACL|nr:alpha-amylase [Cohnella rhizosphaerae]MDG0810152.1 alpha-amylase [Cohnella rhizosphaerae]